MKGGIIPDPNSIHLIAGYFQMISSFIEIVLLRSRNQDHFS